MDGAGDDGGAKLSFALSFEAFGELDAPIVDVDGIDSVEFMLLSKNVIGDDVDG